MRDLMKRLCTLSVLAFCILCGCGHGFASKGPTVADILSFTEEEYFRLDEEKLESRESRLIDTDFMGVAVSAPRKVDIGKRDKLPLVIGARYDGDRGWDVLLGENCILIGTNLSDGTVHFAKAFLDEKELKSRVSKEKEPRGPKPSGLALEAAELNWLDAKARLKMKWSPGSWSLGVIYYDWASNTVVVNLVGDKEAGVKPARAVSPEPSLTSAGGLPCYLATSHTPPSPESGVVFNGEFSGKHGDQHLKITGAFTIPVRAVHMQKQKMVHKFKDRRQENVAAVVPVTLAVVGLDWEKPLQFDWAVPVYGGQLRAGMPAKGFFTLDAFASGNIMELGPGRYACYLIVDGRIYGPKIIEVPGRTDTGRQ